ncbi:ThuA domain-containing protein [Polyangium aurulentum]|uniref:ThuA domain-containing protein n=1 Tax=Polyangium aurulentum TaxID=2567896 RepID=UPI0010AE82BD|nr:ThuA domain-containing protein [Polyangium aurulentum]UQA61038.1 hypothetical protein E8A73_011395 [Polyangium aurulentum]
MRSYVLSWSLVATSIVAFAAFPIACAVSGVKGTGSGGAAGSGGSGGSGGTTSSETGGSGGGDAGPDAMPEPGAPCAADVDCADLTSTCSVGACVDGFCQKQGINDFKPCEDGLFCTINDVCVNGTCLGGTSKICPSSGEVCKIGSCDEAMDACTLVPVNEGGSCDDGDPCTDLGTCKAGTCGLGPPINCSHLDGTCSKGVCDKVLGCVAQPLNDGSKCDDGAYCTVNDKCQTGKCTGEPNPCGAPNDPCKVAVCDEITKTCKAVNGNDGASCDDGSACTAGETCASGICVGGMPANPGLSCNDSNACTVGEACLGGLCSGGTPIVACATGDGCCPPGCDALSDQDCKKLKVGVTSGLYYSDDLRAYLATEPFIASAVKTTACKLADLQQFDVVVLWGNTSCLDEKAINAYVQGGGGVIATPWFFDKFGALDALPVTASIIGGKPSYPLQVTVTDPADVLLQGVQFNAGDLVGWEDGSFSLKPGATGSVNWLNDPKKLAVSKWAYGSGRSVYLDFHYITADCDLAIKYPWGQKLVYNAVLWTGKVF